MSNQPPNPSEESFFGEVVFTYTRAQALADGVLKDVTALGRHAGFRWPVAVTAAVWADCVAWTEADSDAQRVPQDETGRLFDVLFMAACAARRQPLDRDRMHYQLYRVPRDGHSTGAELVTLKLMVGPGDHGEPVVTILLPHED